MVTAHTAEIAGDFWLTPKAACSDCGIFWTDSEGGLSRDVAFRYIIPKRNQLLVARAGLAGDSR
jgi:hypothetical protein